MLPAGRVDMSVKELKEKGNAAFKLKKYEVSELPAPSCSSSLLVTAVDMM